MTRKYNFVRQGHIHTRLFEVLKVAREIEIAGGVLNMLSVNTELRWNLSSVGAYFCWLRKAKLIEGRYPFYIVSVIGRGVVSGRFIMNVKCRTLYLEPLPSPDWKPARLDRKTKWEYDPPKSAAIKPFVGTHPDIIPSTPQPVAAFVQSLDNKIMQDRVQHVIKQQSAISKT